MLIILQVVLCITIDKLCSIVSTVKKIDKLTVMGSVTCSYTGNVITGSYKAICTDIQGQLL